MDDFPEEVSTWLSELVEVLLGVTNQNAHDTIEANSETFSKVGWLCQVFLTKFVSLFDSFLLCCMYEIQFLRSASAIFVYKKGNNEIVVVDKFESEFEQQSVILYLINHGIDVLKQPGDYFRIRQMIALDNL